MHRCDGTKGGDISATDNGQQIVHLKELRMFDEIKRRRANGDRLVNPIALLMRIVGLGFLYLGASIKGIGHLLWMDASAAKKEFDF